jgi:hypothetical protein
MKMGHCQVSDKPLCFAEYTARGLLGNEELSGILVDDHSFKISSHLISSLKKIEIPFEEKKVLCTVVCLSYIN